MVFVDTIFAEYQGKRYFGNWQKLSAWSLTDYERIVLLDSNHLILHPIDDLQTLLFSHGLHHSGGDRNDYIAAVLTAPGHPHPSTIILHPSLAQYQRLRSTLNEFFFSRANEQDVLVMAYRGRVASLLGGYSALESKWGGYVSDDGARVKVRLYDLGRPWEKREGRGAVREWLDVWREVRGEWVGDGMLSGVGLGDGRRRLWERVLGPMVGGGL
ncbi:hypothetical protein CHGG_03412 [Chaetomium globosum CBS 148.51]|uniref:Uncharacterized protein n=1 Tax=Chaetomium globosum (strain ATCC 6205 / CBS 148.51 / DSM 1962 / NBRC 6347 / NRRL 1970) TaxID=306901 RepID=Q2H8P2_CHAGB|nr:uncharacterized protein CHGG_03412 [Chaetomium globosum CBS 148.51]EAQ91477.1 hypothetical protein CHGG_03412 [Chaetomium globosum CBS 148.51]